VKKVEWSITGVISLMTSVLIFVGLFGLFTNHNPDSFYFHYVKEDGLVEWMTLVFLLACAVIYFKRFFKLKLSKPKIFLIFLLLQGFLLLFAAGEEVSWGQRMFNYDMSDFFLQNNFQHETNIHNLVVFGIYLNTSIFGSILDVIFVIYLIFLPILYQKYTALKLFFAKTAIAVPKLKYIILFWILNLPVQLSYLFLPNVERRSEMVEMLGVMIIFLVLLDAKNKEIYE
jgi:hypothetical protein